MYKTIDRGVLHGVTYSDCFKFFIKPDNGLCYQTSPLVGVQYYDL